MPGVSPIDLRRDMMNPLPLAHCLRAIVMVRNNSASFDTMDEGPLVLQYHLVILNNALY